MSTSEQDLVRTIDGVKAPVAGPFGFDPSHSTVGFVVRHLVVSKIRGRFGRFDGTLTVADEPAASSVRVSIEAASIDTGDVARDDHLRTTTSSTSTPSPPWTSPRPASSIVADRATP